MPAQWSLWFIEFEFNKTQRWADCARVLTKYPTRPQIRHRAPLSPAERMGSRNGDRGVPGRREVGEGASARGEAEGQEGEDGGEGGGDEEVRWMRVLTAMRKKGILELDWHPTDRRLRV